MGRPKIKSPRPTKKGIWQAVRATVFLKHKANGKGNHKGN
jgi:hypothetical protein